MVFRRGFLLAGGASCYLVNDYASQACRQENRNSSPILGPEYQLFMTGIVHKGAITSFFLLACEFHDF